MAYKPNFSDPRVKTRIRKALRYVSSTFPNDCVVKNLSTLAIHHANNLGCQTNQSSRYIKRLLLIETNSSYFFGGAVSKTKSYKLNPVGVAFLKAALDTPELDYDLFVKTYDQRQSAQQSQQDHADVLFQQYQDEIATGEFVMTERSNREYHPLQFIKSDIRRQKFRDMGYRYDYDIQAAAPTIRLQKARMSGFTAATPTLDSYLASKELIRHQLASEAKITYAQAKDVILGLLQGGNLAAVDYCRIYTQILLRNYNAIQVLKQSPFILALRAELRLLWSHLTRDIPRTIHTDRLGRRRQGRVSGSIKSGIYRQEEQVVMSAVKMYIKNHEFGVRLMTEHDGWRTDRLIDVNELKSSIRRTTGYLVQIDMEVL